MKRGKVYNRFYSEELYEQVNPRNKAILKDFLEEYKQRKKAQSTISTYFQNLRIVFIYILKELDNKCILDLSKKNFRGLNIYLSEDCGMSGNRVNTIHSSMNSLLTFCEEDDDYDYDINYSKKIKTVPRSPVKDNEDDFFFTFKEFIAVRDILVEQNKLQLAVMWSLAFDSGARRNEVHQVKKHNLLNGNKTNKVKGKGWMRAQNNKKEFTLVYLDDTKELIRQYLEQRGDDDIDSLWIKGEGDNKSPISYQTLYTRIVAISKILSEVRNEKCAIFFHTTRHSRIECMLQGEDDRLKNPDGTNKVFTLDQVKALVHHEDVATTSSYAKDHSEEEIDNMLGFN